MRGRELSKIARAAKLYAVRNREDELPFLQLQVFRHILKHPGCHLCDVADAIGSDKAAISRMLTSLERKGYIRKEKCGRWLALYATKTISNLDMECKDREQQFYEWLFAQLPKAEKTHFLKLLDQLYQYAKAERKSNYQHVNKEVGK